MPAVVIEDAAFNYTSSIVAGVPTVYSLPFPNAAAAAAAAASIVRPTSDSDDYYWMRQDQQYQETSSHFGFIDDDDNFGSPLPFDASENGLWNGRFVPPPPRPPFMDESIIADGVTTCDLCSWAMPTKSTFIFEGTIEKATELGWPLTLIIVSVISAILGAILMITIVRCKRKKSSSSRNETNVQWWSRNKRPNGQSNRRNNIYTGNPADSIRGLHNTDMCNWSNVTNFVVNS